MNTTNDKAARYERTASRTPRAHYKQPGSFNKPTMPDTTGILTDDQLADLGRIKISLWKIKDVIDHVNALAIDTGLPLRLIPAYPIALMSNDISRCAYAHETAEKRIRAAAFEAVERMAA